MDSKVRITVATKGDMELRGTTNAKWTSRTLVFDQVAVLEDGRIIEIPIVLNGRPYVITVEFVDPDQKIYERRGAANCYQTSTD